MVVRRVSPGPMKALASSETRLTRTVFSRRARCVRDLDARAEAGEEDVLRLSFLHAQRHLRGPRPEAVAPASVAVLFEPVTVMDCASAPPPCAAANATSARHGHAVQQPDRPTKGFAGASACCPSCRPPEAPIWRPPVAQAAAARPAPAP